MNRFFITLAIMLALTFSCFATDNTSNPADTTRKEPSNAELTNMMSRLRRQHDLVGAMQCATLLLSRNENNLNAAGFMHDNWNAMIRQVNKELEANNDEYDIEQCEARCRLYQRLSVVEDNLRSVKMPLHGSGNRWVWQPELLYVEGTYQSERQHLAALLRTTARQALVSYNAQEAQRCYDKLLNTNLLYPAEQEGNRKILLEDCNQLLGEKTRHKNNITDLLFAYELTTLSLFLDEQQTDVADIQQQLTADISHRYEQLAENYLNEGDSVRAQEYKLAAEEWK